MDRSNKAVVNESRWSSWFVCTASLLFLCGGIRASVYAQSDGGVSDVPQPAPHTQQFLAPSPPQTSPAAPPPSVQEKAPEQQTESTPKFTNESDIPVMAETIVEGSAAKPFQDPFADPFEEKGIEKVYDPWEGFNTAMFDFNYNLDRYFLKPAAQGYNWFMPPDMQDSIGNMFDNAGIVPRLMNDMFQGKFKVAGVEFTRFLINSTMGIGGMFDIAKYQFGLEAPNTEDTGQTLAVSGVGSGPYLVIPFLGPMTVRDGFGRLGDAALNPFNWFVPFVPNVAARGEEIVNTRSRNLEFFEGVEESTLDLYGAVRTAYFEKRSKEIKK